MIHLSVNINKIATLRNSRGGDYPNVVTWAQEIEQYGADGITVHPRPDERHIKYQDVYDLSKVLKKEFNIEGNPIEEKFVQLVLENNPAQVTLVPDATQQLTSNAGWDTIQYETFLKEIIQVFKNKDIRVSIFVDPVEEMVRGAKTCGADRIELYTEAYAAQYNTDKITAIQPYKHAANIAKELDLGINAGHDLSLENLEFFASEIPFLDEVSIGHALIGDALRFGMNNTVNMYQNCLNKY